MSPFSIRSLAVMALATFGLAACDAQVGQNSSQVSSTGQRPGDPGFSVVPQGAPSGPVVEAFAINVLNGLQSRSIVERREYCGYIFIDSFARLQATAPRAGSATGCEMPEPLIGQGVIASYHTHGAYSPALSGEAPSTVDLRGDFNYGIDGYVSTPGGRVWLVDYQTRSTWQLCGMQCVTWDPNFPFGSGSAIQPSYTMSTLQARERAL